MSEPGWSGFSSFARPPRNAALRGGHSCRPAVRTRKQFLSVYFASTGDRVFAGLDELGHVELEAVTKSSIIHRLSPNADARLSELKMNRERKKGQEIHKMPDFLQAKALKLLATKNLLWSIPDCWITDYEITAGYGRHRNVKHAGLAGTDGTPIAPLDCICFHRTGSKIVRCCRSICR